MKINSIDLVCFFFGLVLRHINHCRLFNAKSILIYKTVLFQANQFSISTQFWSIWHIDETLSGATTPGQSGPWSDGNRGVLCISQSSSITGALSSDSLFSYYQNSRWWSLTSLQRFGRCILQPQMTEPMNSLFKLLYKPYRENMIIILSFPKFLWHKGV